MGTKIAIVVYPFFDVRRPALGPTILKRAVYDATGVDVDLQYLNIAFRDKIGDKLYDWILDLPTTLLAGDWVFSEALFGANPQADGAYKDLVTTSAFITRDGESDVFGQLLEARSHVSAFNDWALKAIDWDSYVLIGFSSIFQQHVGSLSFAKLLKASNANIPNVFGGANCEGEMGEGTLSAFTFVDYVCSGEGEIVLVDLVAKLIRDASLPRRRLLRSTTLQRLDDLPQPRFEDYFEQLDRSRFGRAEAVLVPFETSRGCWWGQKTHCTFCGLNGEAMRFRQKTPGRAASEIRELWSRYGGAHVVLAATDNIMPAGYVKTVLPQIEDLGANLFYEVKANLDHQDLRQLQRAGIRTIQPGIEQLSTRLLRLLRKGTTALKNLALLRDCAQFRIRPLWNFLVDIPAENESDYEPLLELLPSIFHLPPPGWGKATPIRFDRFSPYLERSGEYGLNELKPVAAYAPIYHALDERSAKRIAYYFAETALVFSRDHPVKQRVCELIAKWHDVHGVSALIEIGTDHSLLIIDLRGGSTERVFRLPHPWDTLFLSLREPTSRARIIERASTYFALNPQEIDLFLDCLANYKLVGREDDHLVSLSVGIEDGYELPQGLRQRAKDIVELTATHESWTVISGSPA